MRRWLDWVENLRNPCHNGGNWTGESCNCLITFSGERCENCTCQNGGVCLPSSATCACRGKFRGPLCQTCTASEPKTCTGRCLPHWYGDVCQRHCHAETTCSGHGTCDPATGRCRCGDYTRYTGDDCSVPCQCAGDRRAGVCHATSGICQCNDGRRGERCEAECPRNDAGEVCSGYPCDAQGACECPPEIGGKACQDTCPESYGGWPCDGHGKCQRGKCLCDPGYVGVGCQCDRDSCSGHGKCNDDGTACLCDASHRTGFWAGMSCRLCARGFHGWDCTAYCEPEVTCSSYGTCEYDLGNNIATCRCSEGLNQSDYIVWGPARRDDEGDDNHYIVTYEFPEHAYVARVIIGSTERLLPVPNRPGHQVYEAWIFGPNDSIARNFDGTYTISKVGANYSREWRRGWEDNFNEAPPEARVVSLAAAPDSAPHKDDVHGADRYGRFIARGPVAGIKLYVGYIRGCRECKKDYYPTFDVDDADVRHCSRHCTATTCNGGTCDPYGKCKCGNDNVDPDTNCRTCKHGWFPMLRTLRHSCTSHCHSASNSRDECLVHGGLIQKPTFQVNGATSGVHVEYVGGTGYTKPAKVKLLEGEDCACLPWTSERVSTAVHGVYGTKAGCRSVIGTQTRICPVDTTRCSMAPATLEGYTGNMRFAACKPGMRHHADVDNPHPCNYCSGRGVCNDFGTCRCVKPMLRYLNYETLDIEFTPWMGREDEDVEDIVYRASGYTGPHCDRPCGGTADGGVACSGHGECVATETINYCRCDSQPIASKDEYEAAVVQYKACPADKIRDPDWIKATLTNQSWIYEPGLAYDVRKARMEAQAGCNAGNARVMPKKKHDPHYFGTSCQYSCKDSPLLTFRGRPCNGYPCINKFDYIARHWDSDRGVDDNSVINHVPCEDGNVGRCCPKCSEAEIARQRIYCHHDPFDDTKHCAKLGCKCPDYLSGDACELRCKKDMAIGVNAMPSPCGRRVSPNNQCCLNDPYPKCTADEIYHVCTRDHDTRTLGPLLACGATPSIYVPVKDPRMLTNCGTRCRVLSTHPAGAVQRNHTALYRCTDPTKPIPDGYTPFDKWHWFANVPLNVMCQQPNLIKLANTTDGADGENTIAGYCHCARGTGDGCDITCPCVSEDRGHCPSKGTCACTHVKTKVTLKGLTKAAWDKLEVHGNIFDKGESAKYCDHECNATCPMHEGQPCAGVGRCLKNCKCQCMSPKGTVKSGLTGADCSLVCPGYDLSKPEDVSGICSGHGTCTWRYDKLQKRSVSKCECNQHYAGRNCENDCRGHDCNGGESRVNHNFKCDCICDEWLSSKSQCEKCIKGKNYDPKSSPPCSKCLDGYDINAECKYPLLQHKWAQKIVTSPHAACVLDHSGKTHCDKMDSTANTMMDMLAFNTQEKYKRITCSMCNHEFASYESSIQTWHGVDAKSSWFGFDIFGVKPDNNMWPLSSRERMLWPKQGNTGYECGREEYIKAHRGIGPPLESVVFTEDRLNWFITTGGRVGMKQNDFHIRRHLTYKRGNWITQRCGTTSTRLCWAKREDGSSIVALDYQWLPPHIISPVRFEYFYGATGNTPGIFTPPEYEERAHIDDGFNGLFVLTRYSGETLIHRLTTFTSPASPQNMFCAHLDNEARHISTMQSCKMKFEERILITGAYDMFSVSHAFTFPILNRIHIPYKGKCRTPKNAMWKKGTQPSSIDRTKFTIAYTRNDSTSVHIGTGKVTKETAYDQLASLYNFKDHGKVDEYWRHTRPVRTLGDVKAEGIVRRLHGGTAGVHCIHTTNHKLNCVLVQNDKPVLYKHCHMMHVLGVIPKSNDACTQGVTDVKTETIYFKNTIHETDPDLVREDPYIRICAVVVEAFKQDGYLYCYTHATAGFKFDRSQGRRVTKYSYEVPRGTAV